MLSSVKSIFFYSMITLVLTIFSGCGYYYADLAKTAKNKGKTIAQLDAEAFAQNETTGGSGAPINSGLSSSLLLFQALWTDNVANRGNGAAGPFVANGGQNIYSIGAYIDRNDSYKKKLLVSDRSNHRLLIFNNIPTSSTAIPDVVVGQSDFTMGGATTGKNFSLSTTVANAKGFDNNVHVAVCANGVMFVADRGNHRILAFNKIPTTNGATADFVIGQPDLVSNTANNGALTQQSQKLNAPYSVNCYNGKLYVSDQGNKRVLVYNTIPTTGAPNSTPVAADFAIGQPDLNTVSAGSPDFNSSSSYMGGGYEVLFYDNKMYVADGAAYHRILVYNTIPTVANAKPDFVIGQPDATTVGYNNINSTTPTQSSLYFVNGLAARDNKLAVSDYNNGRILFFNLPITTNGPNANYILGKADYVTGGLSATAQGTFGGARSLLYDGNYIWVADGNQNNRIQALALPY